MYNSTTMSSLLKRVAILQKETKERKMVTGEDFSPFNLGIIKLDENTVSKILSYFLDTTAAHGQKDYFLRKFLELIPTHGIFDFNLVGAKSTTEESMINKRRIDIYIKGDNFSIGIENKLGAADQKNQVADSLHWLGKENNYFLIYLSPAGKLPTEYSFPDESRKQHAGHFFVVRWIELIEKFLMFRDEIPLKIFYFINDFCNSINNKLEV